MAEWLVEKLLFFLNQISAHSTYKITFSFNTVFQFQDLQNLLELELLYLALQGNFAFS